MQDQEKIITATNLTNCDKEPIHIIGHIQPHGALVVIDMKSYAVVNYSENLSSFLQTKNLSSFRYLNDLFPDDFIIQLKKELEANKTLSTYTFEKDRENFLLIPHVSDDKVIIDVEKQKDKLPSFTFQQQLNNILSQIEKTTSLKETSQIATQLIKNIFGYNRVMLYRFDKDWNGEVIAETKDENLETWLGLRYPASDIPKPAREIFLKQGVRVISDVYYKPSPILSLENSNLQPPINLTNSELRGVSPIHIEYLKNMKVNASLTTSIIVNGKLWGLITCHHYKAKTVDYFQRQSCKFLTQVFANQINLLDTKKYVSSSKQLETLRKKLMLQMQSVSKFKEALLNYQPNLKDFIDCGGVALVRKNKINVLGGTPLKKEIEILIREHLAKQKKSIYFTESLSSHFASAEAYTKTASGILAISLDANFKDFIIWFRPEIITTIEWGGNPEKNGYVKDGVTYLHPRKSFEKWSEKVAGSSKVWENSEIEAAAKLQENINTVLVKKQKEKIKLLNNKLKRVNKELETFSYSVSHDLRAPLRGIDGYARILKEHLNLEKDDYSTHALETIISSSKKMDVLIDDILSYSKIGRQDIRRITVDLNTVVFEIINSSNLKINYPQTQIKAEKNLPKVFADSRMVTQVCANLITNAIKYSQNQKEPFVEIGYKEESKAYFVKDNGIGIDEKYIDKIFNVFTRLASADYEGSGIGLAIVKKSIDLHEGKVWVETKLNEGTTFFFNFGNA